MKYVILSFDDGLSNFMEVVYPLLEHYGFKASVNIVGYFCKKGLDNKEFSCMSPLEVLALDKNGYEIAVHSYTHSKSITSNDIKECYTFLSNLLNKQNFGYITPYSIHPSNEVINYLRENNYLYCADYKYNEARHSLRVFLLRLLNHFINNSHINEIVKNYRYIYKRNKFLKNGLHCFHRVCVSKTCNLKSTKSLLKLMKNNDCITFMFHSILKDIKEPCSWPDGAWSSRDFEELLQFLITHPRYKVILQRDLVNYDLQ